MPELVCAADDPRWHDERRKGVTATDITAIVGLSPYESEYSLYWKKLGHIPDVREDSPRMRLGRDLEPLIMRRWAEEHDMPGPQNAAGLWRSDARPWQLATPDAVLIWESLDAVEATVELKSWADADRHTWQDGPPPRVRAQVLWQMDTLDVAVGHVGVLFLPSGEFRSYVIEHGGRDPWDDANHGEACTVCFDQETLRTIGEEFMRRLRLELPPPSPDASSATLAALKARFADPRKTKEAEIEVGLWNAWYGSCSEVDRWEKTKRAYEAEMREQAGDAGIYTVGGVKVATRQRYTVKAHTRKESTVDKIVRSKGASDATED